MIDLRTASYGAFTPRVALGAATLAHGLTKLIVFTPAGTAGFFESIGYPGALGIVVMGAEIVLGLALLLGVHTRVAAGLMVPILLGATATHFSNGWQFANEGGGWEFPAFWTAALVAQALIGGQSRAQSS